MIQYYVVSISLILGHIIIKEMYRGYRNSTYSSPYTQHSHSIMATPYTQQKYQQDIQCVFPSHDASKGAIYVSNVEAAQNIKTLDKYKIKAVMTCAKGYHQKIPKSKLDMFEYFPCEDKDACPISVYFDQAVDFIIKALSQTNILVHCIAGVSRSVSMVLAYLIRQKGMSYQQAYQSVKKRRKIISPNDGFIRQLKQYALKHSGKSKQSKDYTSLTENKRQRQKSSYIGNTTDPKLVQRYRYQQKMLLNKGYGKPKNNAEDSITHKNSHHQQSNGRVEDECGKTASFGGEQIIDAEFTQNNSDIKLNSSNIAASMADLDYKTPIKNQNNEQRFAKSHSFIESSSKTHYQKNANESKLMRTPQSKTTNDYMQRGNSANTHQNNNGTNKTSYTQSKSAYFKEMNRELNDKIAAIHSKYEIQRENLMLKRGYSLTNNTNTKNRGSKQQQYELKTNNRRQDKYSHNIPKTDYKYNNDKLSKYNYFYENNRNYQESDKYSKYTTIQYNRNNTKYKNRFDKYDNSYGKYGYNNQLNKNYGGNYNSFNYFGKYIF